MLLCVLAYMQNLTTIIMRDRKLLSVVRELFLALSMGASEGVDTMSSTLLKPDSRCESLRESNLQPLAAGVTVVLEEASKVAN